MTVKITDPDVVQKMAAADGIKSDLGLLEYLHGHLSITNVSREHSLIGCVHQLKQWHERALLYKREYPELYEAYLTQSKSSVAIAYGAGGYNRYMITQNGVVHFSMRHSTTPGLYRALILGFDIWK